LCPGEDTPGGVNVALGFCGRLAAGGGEEASRGGLGLGGEAGLQAGRVISVISAGLEFLADRARLGGLGAGDRPRVAPPAGT